jgi:antitoxin (DNA-binding transcriptional repressor) of toxin-antitoxin stability system
VESISIEEIQRYPARCLARVKAGETLVVTEAEQPIAELRPVVDTRVAVARAGEQAPRPAGLAAGEFTVPDDFDEPLPEAILRLFEAT